MRLGRKRKGIRGFELVISTVAMSAKQPTARLYLPKDLTGRNGKRSNIRSPMQI